MPKETKRQAQKVAWFIDFLNADLSILPVGEKMKLVTDTVNILIGQGEYLFGGKLHPIPWKGSPLEQLTTDFMEGPQLVQCQKRLRAFFNDLMKTIYQAKGRAQESWKPAPEFSPFFSLGEVQSTVTVSLDLFAESEIRREGDDLLQRYTQAGVENTPITLTFKGPTHEETLLFYFVQALDGFHVGALRQCLECDKWFVHTSKKVKIYCSNKCAARNATRAKRARMKDEDPETYKKELQANKKRAVKSYDKKLPRGAKRIPHKK